MRRPAVAPRPVPQLRLATSCVKLSRTPAEQRAEAFLATILQSGAYLRDFPAPPPPPPPPDVAPPPVPALRLGEEPFTSDLLAHPLLSEGSVRTRKQGVVPLVVRLLNELLQPPAASAPPSAADKAAAARAAPPAPSCEGRHRCPACLTTFYFVCGPSGPSCPTCGYASFSYLITTDPYRTFEGEENRQHWDSLPSHDERRERLAAEEVHRLGLLCVRAEGVCNVAQGHLMWLMARNPITPLSVLGAAALLAALYPDLLQTRRLPHAPRASLPFSCKHCAGHESARESRFCHLLRAPPLRASRREL